MCPSAGVLSSFLAVATALLRAASSATNVASLAVPYKQRRTNLQVVRVNTKTKTKLNLACDFVLV